MKARGRPFQTGNPGRMPGSLNRSTLIAKAITQEDKQDILQRGLALAKQNDPQMLKFFLDRFLPKQQLVQFPLSAIKNHSDLVTAYNQVLQAVCAGELSPADASVVFDMLQKIQLLLPDVELEGRVRALEAEINKLRGNGIDQQAA
jgi:hypothetical protein